MQAHKICLCIMNTSLLTLTSGTPVNFRGSSDVQEQERQSCAFPGLHKVWTTSDPSMVTSLTDNLQKRGLASADMGWPFPKAENCFYLWNCYCQVCVTQPKLLTSAHRKSEYFCLRGLSQSCSMAEFIQAVLIITSPASQSLLCLISRCLGLWASLGQPIHCWTSSSPREAKQVP